VTDPTIGMECFATYRSGTWGWEASGWKGIRGQCVQ